MTKGLALLLVTSMLTVHAAKSLMIKKVSLQEKCGFPPPPPTQVPPPPPPPPPNSN